MVCVGFQKALLLQVEMYHIINFSTAGCVYKGSLGIAGLINTGLSGAYNCMVGFGMEKNSMYISIGHQDCSFQLASLFVLHLLLLKDTLSWFFCSLQIERNCEFFTKYWKGCNQAYLQFVLVGGLVA